MELVIPFIFKTFVRQFLYPAALTVDTVDTASLHSNIGLERVSLEPPNLRSSASGKSGLLSTPCESR